MNPEEAKAILSVYRPGIDDPSDPLVQEALALLEKDEALSLWYLAEKEFDNHFGSKIKSSTAPRQVRDDILVSLKQQDPNAEFETSPPAASRSLFPSWFQPSQWSIAASIAIVLSIVYFTSKPNSVVASPEALVDNLSSHYASLRQGSLSYYDEDILRLQQHLRQHSQSIYPENFDLTQKFQQAQGLGCFVGSYGQTRLTLTCFRYKNNMYHLYVVKAVDYPQLEISQQPIIVYRGGYSFKVWQDSGRIMTLMSTQSRFPEGIIIRP